MMQLHKLLQSLQFSFKISVEAMFSLCVTTYNNRWNKSSPRKSDY